MLSRFMDIEGIKREIDTKQTLAIEKRVDEGQIRAFELYWAKLLMEYHNFHVVPTWTAKQRGNGKDIIRRFGAKEAKGLMLSSVRNWERIRVTYPFLPPKPVFDVFCFQRDKFLAVFVAETEAEAKRGIEVRKAKALQEEKRVTPAKSLTEMFKDERRKGNGRLNSG